MRSGNHSEVSGRRVGIARGLVHYVGPFDWQSVFQTLGYETVVSASSTYGVFEDGFRYATNDQCLPVKVYFGHLLALDEKVDFFFIPQYSSLRKGCYRCPKIIGLPQMAAKTIPLSHPILSVTIDLHEPLVTAWRILRFLSSLSRDPVRIHKAFTICQEGLRTLLRSSSMAMPKVKKSDNGRRIGILGHEYALNDRFLNCSLLLRIERRGFEVVTSEAFRSAISDEAIFDCAPLHWDFGQEIVTAAKGFLSDESVQGIVFVTFFGCGIDAFIEELFKRAISEVKPYLCFSVDEHSGEAGIVTRIEAFLDMIGWRQGCM